MKKNTIAYSVIALLIAVMIVGNVSAASRVEVSGFKIINGEARVGQDFTLSLTLTNLDQTCVTAATTTIQAGSPFIMNGVSTVIDGDICPGTPKTVNIPMKIDPTGKGGTYQITIINSYESTTYTEYTNTNTINLFVNGTPEINANIVNSDPVDVYPGDTGLITVNIENDGTFTAQSINTTMTTDAALTISWAKSFASIGSLDAKQSKQAQFAVEVPKDAESKDYPLYLTMNYIDENYNVQTRIFQFNFHVKEKAQFSTTDAGSDGLFPNTNGKTIKLNLKNTGTDVANKIKIRIQPQFPFSTDGSIRYIETLNPGQELPVEFQVDVDKDGTVGTYNLDMILDYQDAQGKALQDTANVALTVQHKNIFQAVFLDYWFIWLVVIIVAAIILRRRSAKKKK